MRKFIDKTKATLSNSTYQLPNTSSAPKPTHSPPSTLDLLSYRSHHGTNLGSILVLEKWLFPSMFSPSAQGDSELDAVTASINEIGIETTRLRWGNHWSSALSDEEIEFLAFTAGITSVRLPIGYFTLGAKFTSGTPFDRGVAKIYENAWDAVLKLCERLYTVGIGVLLDFHALPGNANTEDHGGVSTRKAELWGSRHNLELAKRCLVWIAEEVKKGSVKGCVGIQLCNEACWGAKGMYKWYEDCVGEIGEVDPSIPLYISEAWDLGPAMEWCKKMNKNGIGKGRKNPIGVATPRYYSFTDHDKSQSPQQIIERACNELDDVAAASGNVVDKGALQVFVGEWSCAINGDSWAKAGSEDRDELVRQFGAAQSEQWRRRAGGAFFWTAKMQWMDGGEWGLFEMVKKGALVPPTNLMLAFEDVRVAAERARRQRLNLKNPAVGAHVGYWDSMAPGVHFEHWRFEEGWDLGFADALAFFEMRMCGKVEGARKGADVIGCLEMWIAKRLGESQQSGGLVWEWEHGFRQGVAAFSGCVCL